MVGSCFRTLALLNILCVLILFQNASSFEHFMWLDLVTVRFLLNIIFMWLDLDQYIAYARNDGQKHFIKTLHKCIMADTSAIWQQAAHTT